MQAYLFIERFCGGMQGCKVLGFGRLAGGTIRGLKKNGQENGKLNWRAFGLWGSNISQ